jgi:hypothetical protein
MGVEQQGVEIFGILPYRGNDDLKGQTASFFAFFI